MVGQPTSVSATPSNVSGGGQPQSHPGVFMGVFVPPNAEKAPAKARKPKDPSAPKKPRGRPKKDASLSLAKQETDASASDSDSDEFQIEEMPEPTPDLLRGPPPEILEHRVIYEIATAVWSPRNKPAVSEKVRTGIALFGDVVKKQRDAWKVKNEALKQAELANTTAIPSLKQEVAQFRKTIETVAVQALRFGHPAHLAKYVYPYLRLLCFQFTQKSDLKMESLARKFISITIYVAMRQNRSMLLPSLQSHNKGLDNGYGTKSWCRGLHNATQWGPFGGT
jgi:hypothetical protein